MFILGILNEIFIKSVNFLPQNEIICTSYCQYHYKYQNMSILDIVLKSILKFQTLVGTLEGQN